ncbi:MAG: 2-phosphosulfolactate phosphatase [Candidatus Heimdallarchaeota archaeon]|nr:2-phosphosulfolactate phosphatase [Candidatus Heimdallarchaeota archaeon]
MREFGDGAFLAAKDKGITVIIDNFRASNTILALLELTNKVKPVLHPEEAYSMKGYIKVGEDSRDFSKFDYDNSPHFIDTHPEIFLGKKVVIRTTNGTRGLVNAIGSAEILVGAFRNLSRVVDYCISKFIEGYPISFVAMGSKEISRIEDTHGAKMLYFRMLQKLKDPEFHSEDNPWLRDWLSEIKAERPFEGNDREDREYCVNIDASLLLPFYDPVTGLLELLN